MAISVGRVGSGPHAAYAYFLREITCDSSYPSGGYFLGDARAFGLTAIHQVIPVCSSSAYKVVFDAPNSKAKLYKGTAGPLVEETGGTDLSSLKFYVLISGV